MDQNAVYQLFVSTYHPDPNVHRQAESSIGQIESQPEFLPLVLQIQASEDLDLGARQAAAIYFKNRIYRDWTHSGNVAIGEEDKSMIRGHILRALVTTPPTIQVQLAASLHNILNHDFPDEWPSFIQELEAFLTSQDVRTVYVGLIALREVVKVFQWKSMERREPLLHIIRLTFPAIQSICNTLIPLDTLEAAEMLKLALKIYNSSIQVDLPECLQKPSSLAPWGTLFLQLVSKRIPNHLQPVTDDPEELENFVWWKTKKWAYRCLNRLFGKYGNPALLPSDSQYHAFASSFIANFAPNILQTYLQQIEGWIKKEHWLSNKCLALSAAFFDDCIKHKITWAIVKPHTDTLIAHFLFPLLCFSPEDERLWMENPVEYVHKRVDPLEDFHSAENNITVLLIDLARDRKKQTFMNILGFVNNVINKYMETPEEQKDGRDKDGALCMISALSSIILDSNEPEIIDMMEPFFVTHVFPEFKSRFPYLRARACDITRSFSNLEFTEEQNLGILYLNVVDCLRDPEFPVRVQAALALQPMLRHESVREAMIPDLRFIMQEILNLTNMLDMDNLGSVLDEFVQVFANHLAPFAHQLCLQLSDTFVRTIEEVNQLYQDHENSAAYYEDADEAGNKMMTAMGVLKTMSTIILSLDGHSDTLPTLEVVLIPVITSTLKKRIVELYDEIFDIIDAYLFASKRVTNSMWGVFEITYTMFKESNGNRINDMLSVLDNFISYGKDGFISNDTVKHMLLDMIDTVMKSEELTESDRVSACKLMESILLNCRGSVDMCVTIFSHLCLPYILSGQMKSTEFKVHCIEVIINCLYYNPFLTLQVLDNNQWVHGFFNLWFSMLEKFTRVHDKKLTIVALCSLLSLTEDQIPVSLQEGWTHILVSLCEVFRSLPKAIENRESMEKGEEEGDDEFEAYDEGEEEEEEDEDKEEELVEEDEEENKDNDEDGNVQDEDAQYLEFLAKQSANTYPKAEEEEEEEDELSEEILFQSPLDEVDPYFCFAQVFEDMQQRRPNMYDFLTKDLNGEQQEIIMNVIWKTEGTRSM
ncbi:MAG: armadillo-type protein [Benjaminiella poitrasii]|nr:MAG: armadillo-type protein [Benjaminiella poitrasii]